MKQFRFEIILLSALCMFICAPAVSGQVIGTDIDGTLVMEGNVTATAPFGLITAYVTVDRVVNYRASGTHSGALRLEIWKFPSPYNGGSLAAGVVQGQVDMSGLPGRYHRESLNPQIIYNNSPGGSQYVLFLTEHGGGSTDTNWRVVDYLNLGTVLDGRNLQAHAIGSGPADPSEPPANDNYGSSAVMPSAGGTVYGTNVNATKVTLEPLTYAGNSGGRSVWWIWSAPSSGQYTVSTLGSDFDTLLAVYTQTFGLVGENDDFPGMGGASQVTFNAVAGNLYRIVVDGYDGDSGSITLTLATGTVANPNNGEYVDGTNSSRVPIPDGGDWVFSDITISDAPADAVVTSIDVYFLCSHTYAGDLNIDLNDPDITRNYDLWENEGEADDNPSRTVTGITTFNGLPVNGTWYLFVQDLIEEDTGYIEEWSIRIYYTSEVSGESDLIVESITLDPAAPTAGETFTATVVIRNQGTAASPSGEQSGDLDVYLNQPGTIDCEVEGNDFVQIFDEVAAGGTKTFVFSDLPAGLAGTKTFRAFVDSFCVVAETDETNNQATQTYTVLSASNPVSKPVNPYPADGASNIDPGNSLTLTWGNGGGAVNYKVYYSYYGISGGSTAVIDVSSPSPLMTYVLNPVFGDLDYDRTYVWRVHAFDTEGTEVVGDEWTFTTATHPTNPPLNDGFANAVVVQVFDHHYMSNNTNATRESGEPIHGGSTSGKTVWWKLNFPVDAAISLDTTESAIATSMAVYSGDGIGNLSQVASDDSSGKLSFNIQGGVTYHIAVDGRENQSGLIRVLFSIAEPFSSSPWQDITEDANGWKHLDWFGSFVDMEEWIYHAERGWLFCYGESMESFYFYNPVTNEWGWSSESIYPWAWWHMSSEWSYVW